MLLKNKKTGEIIEAVIVDHGAEWEIRNMFSNEDTKTYNSLVELNAEWEDAPEEPKEFYVVDLDGEILPSDFEDKTIEKSKELGNYFSSREEAEKAVEKLKAWKRLKDRGFRFKKWESYEETSGLSFPDNHIVNSYTAIFNFNKPCRKYEIENETKADLDLLFLQEDD